MVGVHQTARGPCLGAGRNIVWHAGRGHSRPLSSRLLTGGRTVQRLEGHGLETASVGACPGDGRPTSLGCLVEKVVASIRETTDARAQTGLRVPFRAPRWANPLG
jgi:hypothetical protein